MKYHSKYIRVLLICLPFLMAACGGGGGGGGPGATVPSALATLPTYTQSSTLANTISWPAVSGASTYSVIRNGVVIATGLTTRSYTDTQNKGQGGTYQIQACNGAGCSPSSPGVKTSATAIVSVASVYLSNSAFGMLTGNTYQLSAGVVPTNATDKTTSWNSDNTAVATVSANGAVTAIAPGTANISANTANGNLQANAKVTVSQTAIAATGINISPSSLSLAAGNKQLLVVSAMPASATNQAVTWSSDNTAIATVDGQGVVTAVSVGSANIKAKKADSALMTNIPITVTPPPTYAVGGSINGLTQSGLKLLLTSGSITEVLPISPGQTAFQFHTQLPGGSDYDVTLAQNPNLEACSVSLGSGTVTVGDVTNISDSCSPEIFTISGFINGLTSPNLKLDYYSTGEDLSVNANATTFQFPHPVPATTVVAMNVIKQPYWQWCTPGTGNTTGALAADITQDTLSCVAANVSVSTVPLPSVTLTRATGTAVDTAGNIYVQDGSRILKVTPSGAVTVFAGSPTGLTGNTDGVGTNARFNLAFSLAIDPSNSNLMYVTDGNNTIRKITLNDATVTTYAGTGSAGNADGPVAAATFNQPTGIAVDLSGNVYVADSANGLIRKITASTGQVTTVASSLTYPMALAVDQFGKIYVADTNHHYIKQIDQTTSPATVTVLAGTGVFGHTDGASLSAQFQTPAGIAVDIFNNLYIAETNGCDIRKITAVAGTTSGSFTYPNVSTIAGPTGCSSGGPVDGIGSNARFGHLVEMSIDADGNLYVADGGNNLIRKIFPSVAP